MNDAEVRSALGEWGFDSWGLGLHSWEAQYTNPKTGLSIIVWPVQAGFVVVTDIRSAFVSESRRSDVAGLLSEIDFLVSGGYNDLAEQQENR